MPVAIGASSIVGIALEVTKGTYLAPTKFIPVNSSSMMFNQEQIKRRPIQGVADTVQSVPGPAIVEGDIEFDVLHDILPYFLLAARMDVTKTGVGPYSYEFVPNHVAEPAATLRSLSITEVKNGQVFGYSGCVVASMDFSVEDGMLKCSLSIMGEDESEPSLPVATWPTSLPFAAGDYTLNYNAVSTNDTDDLTFSIDNGAEAAYRIEGTNAASFIYFGERTITASMSRDFLNRTEYNNYKNATAQDLDFTASDGVNSVVIDLPLIVADKYEIPIEGQGDLIMASVDYEGSYDFATSRAATITVNTDEDITV